MGAPGEVPPCIRQRPFGIAAALHVLPIVGGLAVATVLTLVFLPALYVAVNGIRETCEPAAAAEPELLAPMLAPQHQ